MIFDNGPIFISRKLTLFLNKFGVKHFTSSTYYPQGNGQVISTNKNMVKILKKIIKDKPYHCNTLLTYALWEDHTTKKTSTNHTPFQLLYGQEAIMHVDIELTSLRLTLQEEDLKSTDISQRLHALVDLEEQTSYALDNIKKRQHTLKKYFYKRDKSTTFAANEKVLLWDSAHVDKGNLFKFQNLCLGLYIIALLLETTLIY
jgi:hypothetical protein